MKNNERKFNNWQLQIKGQITKRFCIQNGNSNTIERLSIDNENGNGNLRAKR